VADPTKTLQGELLNVCEPFASLQEAQAALDAFVVEYDTNRPHQSLDMDFPVTRFRPRPVDELGLWIPPTLNPTRSAQPAQRAAEPPTPELPAAVTQPPAATVMSANGFDPLDLAVEITRDVPASGIVTVCGQQFWLGRALCGVTIRLWIDTTVVHLMRDDVRLKTLPSRFTTANLRQLLADGGTPAGPPVITVEAGTAVEVERLVNACGTIGLANRQHPVGYHFAGQRVTVRLNAAVMQILDHDRTLCAP
jgi:hypothetical protein